VSGFNKDDECSRIYLGMKDSVNAQTTEKSENTNK
jgi:hypothetical protein